MPQSSFAYRILIVDDEPILRDIGKAMLETQGYEVITAGDGFEALLALKRALPDVIISDLNMPNMNGFELLAVVRRRFPSIPVIVISGEFIELTCPGSVLADACFPKNQYTPNQLFEKIVALIEEFPTRSRETRSDIAAVWKFNKNGLVVVTCPDCLRTFPVERAAPGLNTASCEFCSSVVRFEMVGAAS